MTEPKFTNPCGHCHNAESLKGTVYCRACIDILSSIEIVEATEGATMTTDELQYHLLGIIDERMEEIQCLNEIVEELYEALEKMFDDVIHLNAEILNKDLEIATIDVSRAEAALEKAI